MALTNIAINKAAPKDKPYKLSDAGGLFLYITPAGEKVGAGNTASTVKKKP